MSKLHGYCILIVDDNEDTNLLFTIALEAEGVEVITAVSAAEVLKLIPWRKPDLILCDIALPDVDGCSLLSTIRTGADRFWRRIPAIAITALSDEKTRQQALNAGFQAYFVKPIDLDTLMATVSNLVTPRVHPFKRTRPTASPGKSQQIRNLT